jgi:hypothetical protein
MRKIVIILLLISLFATCAYAFNVIDWVLYKKVLLDANKMYVLVNRITGEVKYLLLNNGQLVLLAGVMKNQMQAMYNVQAGVKNK